MHHQGAPASTGERGQFGPPGGIHFARLGTQDDKTLWIDCGEGEMPVNPGGVPILVRHSIPKGQSLALEASVVSRRT